jgi:hypothetical protein
VRKAKCSCLESAPRGMNKAESSCMTQPTQSCTASLQFRWLAQPLPHGPFVGEILVFLLFRGRLTKHVNHGMRQDAVGILTTVSGISFVSTKLARNIGQDSYEDFLLISPMISFSTLTNYLLCLVVAYIRPIPLSSIIYYSAFNPLA